MTFCRRLLEKSWLSYILIILSFFPIMSSFVHACPYILNIMEATMPDPDDPLPMITDRVGLDALPEAFEALRKPSTQCKVLVEP